MLRSPKKITSAQKQKSFIAAPAASSGSLQESLLTIIQNDETSIDDKITAIQTAVTAYQAGSDFYTKVTDLKSDFGAAWDMWEWFELNRNFDYESLLNQLTAFGITALSASDNAKLWDNLLAHQIRQTKPEVREAIVSILRVDHLNANKTGVTDEAVLFRLAMAVPVLPEAIFPLPRKSPVAIEKPEDEESENAYKRSLDISTLGKHERAIAELRDIYDSRWEQMRQNTVSDESEPKEPEAPSEEEVVNEVNYDRLTAAAIEALTAETKSLVLGYGIKEGVKIQWAIQVVTKKMQPYLISIRNSVRSTNKLIQVGGSLWLKNSQTHNENDFPYTSAGAELENTIDPYDGFYASNAGCRVRPLGVADLKVVKQTFRCYHANEIAHIENILAGEAKVRETRRLQRREETLFTSTESIREEERDSQTTDRHELSRESSREASKATSFGAGANIMGSYGPVSVSVYANYASSSNTAQSDSSAESFAKEITKRAVQRITERVMEQRTVKTLEEFEEKNTHSITGQPSAHTVGIYRWVDKYYDAHVENYGKRLMFEFVVPEPAAFYLYAQEQATKQVNASLSKPINPRDKDEMATIGLCELSSYMALSEYNYGLYAEAFGAEVAVPPSATKKIGIKPIQLPEDDTNLQNSFTAIRLKALDESVQVPEGYKALNAYVSVVLVPGASSACHVQVGHSRKSFLSTGQIFGFGAIYTPSTYVGNTGTSLSLPTASATNSNLIPLNGEEGILPVSVVAQGTAITVNIEMECVRTDSAYDQWRMDTYNSIMNAYQRQLKDYENALAELQTQAGVQIQGNNPEENRWIERQEMKKASIHLMTHGAGVPFMTAMMDNVPEYNHPEFDTCKAVQQGKYVKFLENAFEWDLMVYEFHPYYWARKSKWIELLQIQDNDPIFKNFLRAGAATLKVAVRRGYETAALYFLQTGLVWEGGTLPITGSTVYQSILGEFEEKVEGSEPIDSTPSSTWEVKLPTDLVILQTPKDPVANDLFCS